MKCQVDEQVSEVVKKKKDGETCGVLKIRREITTAGM